MHTTTQSNIGYHSKFLDGFTIEMPKPNRDLMVSIVQSDELRDGYILDYLNYSVIMNGDENLRSPACVALMIDQNALKNVKRKDNWRLDDRITYDDQLDNDYYANNPWDKGHMARRSTAAWGSYQEAQRRSNETFYFTNCALQHKNLNQDEWLSLEDAVKYWDGDADGKILSFNGCIYGRFDRSIAPQGRTIARIPGGFYKVIAFKNQSGSLEVRAFVIYQDSETLRDKHASERAGYDNMVYQVSLAEVEALTGLEFDEKMYAANPLYYTRSNADASEDVAQGDDPEKIEIFSASSVIKPSQPRTRVLDDDIDVFIAALNKPRRAVSLINLGATDIDLTSWYIQDEQGNRYDVPAKTLSFGEGVSVPLHDFDFKKTTFLILFDQDNNRIDWVRVNEQGLDKDADVIPYLKPTELR
ncbi:DNA/RNA non-specific endonuclease [Vibrio sp. PP-XX7]